MFNPFTWFSDYRLKRLELELAAKNKPYEVLAEAITAQAQFIKQYFEGFKVTELPTATVIREEDEYAIEQERLNPRLRQSIDNAIKAGAFPHLEDMLK